MVKKVKPIPCNDDTLAHHWLISDPEYHYVGHITTGALMETTHWRCLKCGETRENVIEVPLDEDEG